MAIAERRHAGTLPAFQLRAGVAQHPCVERLDRYAVLGDRDEALRPDQALLRVLPAQKRFTPWTLPGGGLAAGLISSFALNSVADWRPSAGAISVFAPARRAGDQQRDAGLDAETEVPLS
jgi:hypothetical protein